MLSKPRLSLLIFLTLVVTAVNSDESGRCSSMDKSGGSIPDYSRIYHASAGPADESFPVDGSPEGIRGRFYRLIFFKSDFPSIRPRMRADEIIYGDAGCCWTVNNSVDIDFDKLEKDGIAMPDAYASGINSVVWLESRKAIISYGNSKCTVANIGKTDIRVSCDLKK